MSKLRQSILKTLRIIGNHSGCHQLPERSFFYKGKQFPVCARCTGVAIGQMVAVIAGVFLRIPLALSLSLLGIMGIDWGIQELKIKKSTNIRRLITGALGGFGVVGVYFAMFRFLIGKFHKYFSQ
ncbi:putative membrane protein [Aequitasia blattaphilus]|uniref:DUF2085 domain-containing protein n=1 Tax=Aequitasia blattaphilus TaxID=2949332 RepID=A0ABT1E7B0_9FIRM|nr:DUF2085 domain-containing protein [Aequitasia blattaphilus]MCP1101725.1 DUF2085 domain-containing protein [Aequitasia blattaphilus]MCR8614365.1 DUF2085 domain-containing protein [Aequitasia blattaphilus]